MNKKICDTIGLVLIGIIVLCVLLGFCTGCSIASADEPTTFLSPVAYLPVVMNEFDPNVPTKQPKPTMPPGYETPTPTSTPMPHTPTPIVTETTEPTATATSTPTNTPTPTATPCVIETYSGIYVDTMWVADCTYIAANGLYVEPGVTLTIPEGVTVLIGSWKTVHVYGSLEVMGTADNKVRFDWLEPDLLWTGIHLGGPGSYLAYATVWGSWAGIDDFYGSSQILNCDIKGVPYTP